jgi:hypothetical protein
MVNQKRPQTSYGGISARQKKLQNSLNKLKIEQSLRGGSSNKDDFNE